MYIFLSGKLIVIETNVAWALPYWTARKCINPLITFKFRN